MAGQNGLLFSKVPRHRSAVYLRIEQSSQLKQEFFIIFQCPLDGEQFTLAVESVNLALWVAEDRPRSACHKGLQTMLADTDRLFRVA